MNNSTDSTAQFTKAFGKYAGLDSELSNLSRLISEATQNRSVVEGQLEARDLAATNFAKGGSLTGDSQPVGIIEALREESLVLRLNPIITRQPTGSAVAPKILSGAIAEWVGENEASPIVDLETGANTLSPKRATCTVRISSQLLKQPGVEDAILRDLRSALGAALDKAILSGTASLGEPVGLLNDTAIQSVTFGGAADLAKAEEFSSTIRNAGTSGQLTLVASPTTASAWRHTLGTPNVNTLWSATREFCTPIESAHITDNRVIVGAFGLLHIHEWSLDIMVDAYTRASFGQVQVTANLLVDFAPIHIGAFCRSTDSANQ
jgi:hypothetical protein